MAARRLWINGIDEDEEQWYEDNPEQSRFGAAEPGDDRSASSCKHVFVLPLSPCLLLTATTSRWLAAHSDDNYNTADEHSSMGFTDAGTDADEFAPVPHPDLAGAGSRRSSRAPAFLRRVSSTSAGRLAVALFRGASERLRNNRTGSAPSSRRSVSAAGPGGVGAEGSTHRTTDMFTPHEQLPFVADGSPDATTATGRSQWPTSQLQSGDGTRRTATEASSRHDGVSTASKPFSSHAGQRYVLWGVIAGCRSDFALLSAYLLVGVTSQVLLAKVRQVSLQSSQTATKTAHQSVVGLP